MINTFAGCNNLSSFIIPEGVTRLGNNAFEECYNLPSITIPSSVISIGSNAFTSTDFASIVVEEGNTIYDSRNDCNAIIEKEYNTLISGCRNTTIPSSVTSIEREAFSGRGTLTSITIPNNVTSIGSAAFFSCSELTSVTVKWETPVAIEEDVFTNRANATLYVPYGCSEAYGAAAYWQDFNIVELVAPTDISQMDNLIYMEPTEMQRGTQATLSLKMKNSAPIRGFQFDLYLPDGVTVAKTAQGKIMGQFSPGRLSDEDQHTLTFSEQPDGAIRFLCGSLYEEVFTGNDGEVVTLTVNIAETMPEDDYPILLKNMVLNENDISKYYETGLVQSVLTIVDYESGDINGDGIVNVLDYTGVANYIHGATPTGFNAKAADVDGNNVIDVRDYTGVANIIHTGSITGSANATARRKTDMKEPQ